MSRIFIPEGHLNPMAGQNILSDMNAIRLLRKSKKWNQGDLAEAASVDQSTISKVENGWDGITLRNLQQIADALDVPIYQLFVDDTTAAEISLMKTYRSLSDGRKKGWQDMALAAKADDPEEGL
jgi:transcriptional regulator with XRE-family HTH domain